MARIVVETVLCDACTKAGEEDVPATDVLVIGPEGDRDEYDLCSQHGKKFRDLLREALGAVTDTALSA